MNQEAACPSYNPEWDPDSVWAIPRYTAATGKSTSESSLTNRYGARRSRMRWVVGGATTCKRGITVPESKPTPTASNHITGSAGRKLSVPWKRSLAVNKQNDDMDTQTSDSNHTWRRSGKHTRRKVGERTQQLETISTPSTWQISSVPISAPTRRMISATASAPVRWWEVKRVWSMPNECNYVYRTASQETVTEWHREKQSRQLPKDDYRIALNGGRRNLGLSGALPTEGTDWYVLPNGLPKRMPNDHTGGL